MEQKYGYNWKARMKYEKEHGTEAAKPLLNSSPESDRAKDNRKGRRAVLTNGVLPNCRPLPMQYKQGSPSLIRVGPSPEDRKTRFLYQNGSLPKVISLTGQLFWSFRFSKVGLLLLLSSCPYITCFITPATMPCDPISLPVDQDFSVPLQKMYLNQPTFLKSSLQQPLYSNKVAISAPKKCKVFFAFGINIRINTFLWSFRLLCTRYVLQSVGQGLDLESFITQYNPWTFNADSEC